MRQDSFDPNSLLDGFHAKLAASQRKVDLDSILDGWKAGSARAGLRPDTAGAPLAPPAFSPGRRWHADVTDVTDVVDVSDLSHARDAARSAQAEAAIGEGELADSLDLEEVSRTLEASVDLSDLESVCAPAVQAAAEATAVGRPNDGWALPVRGGLHGRRDPRVLAKWAPGAWLGAFKPVCEATAEFIASPHGPVVETYPPQMLLALWAPKAGAIDDGLLVSRWPDKALLSAVPGADTESAAGSAAREHLPPDATVWLGEGDTDWALVAELVLHHEPALRPYQLKALRGFADAERQAVFERLNNGYGQPEPGRPVQIKR